MGRRIFIVCYVLVAVFVVYSCFSINSKINKPTAQEIEIADVLNAVPQEKTVSAIEAVNNNDPDSLAAYLSVYEVFLRESYGENLKIDRDENFVTISFWEDGVSELALDAKDGSIQSLTAWNSLVADMIESHKIAKDSFREAGFDDVVVILRLLNDQNLDNVLLIISGGAVLFDAVNEVDLIGDPISGRQTSQTYVLNTSTKKIHDPA